MLLQQVMSFFRIENFIQKNKLEVNYFFVMLIWILSAAFDCNRTKKAHPTKQKATNMKTFILINISPNK